MAVEAKNCEPGKEFVFKLPSGSVIGKAKNITEFGDMVKNAPLESLLYHAKGGHFAPWLSMMGNKEIADRIKALSINDKTVRVSILRCIR